jgi:hypothetical protein
MADEVGFGSGGAQDCDDILVFALDRIMGRVTTAAAGAAIQQVAGKAVSEKIGDGGPGLGYCQTAVHHD